MPLAPDTQVKALGALVSLAFAAVALLGGPRRAANQYLAFFFVLISGNQAAEAMGSYAAGAGEPRDVWFHVAAVCAALDPVMLYYFASLHPRRNALNEGWRPVLVLGAGGFFAFASLWMDGRFTYLPVPLSADGLGQLALAWGLALFTAVVYTAALAHALRGLFAEPREPAWRFLAPAFLVAAAPVWARLPVPPWSALGEAGLLLKAAVFGLGPAVAVAWTLRRRPGATREQRRALWAGALGVAVVIAFLDGFGVASALGLPVGRPLIPQSAVPVRWLIVGALLSMTMLRDESSGMRLAPRRRAARVLVALLFFSLGVILLLIIQGGEGIDLRPVDWVFLAALVAASQAFRSLVDRVAHLAYGVPMPGDPVARQEAYRRAVGRALAAGVAPRDDPDLARLRAELELDSATARAVEREAEAAPAGPLMPGRLVARRYRLVALLGSGSGGRAFLARDETLGRDAVVKEVLVDDAASEEHRLREARLAARVRHPNVVTVYDAIEAPGAILLVTEHVPGGTLAARLERDGPLPPAEGAALLRGVLAGLAAVHAAGVVHGDVKPENVLLDEDGRPKVADFGVARPRRGVTVGYGEDGAFVGTPAYMAPEQASGRLATAASDVYAAGLLARRALRAPLPPAVERVVARALEEDPGRRWASAGEMLGALAAAVDEQGAADADEVSVVERRGRPLA